MTPLIDISRGFGSQEGRGSPVPQARRRSSVEEQLLQDDGQVGDSGSPRRAPRPSHGFVSSCPPLDSHASAPLFPGAPRRRQAPHPPHQVHRRRGPLGAPATLQGGRGRPGSGRRCRPHRRSDAGPAAFTHGQSLHAAAADPTEQRERRSQQQPPLAGVPFSLLSSHHTHCFGTERALVLGTLLIVMMSY